MYALVANGIQTICKTQQELETCLSLYPYPKFAKVKDINEGRQWLRNHSRIFNNYEFKRYGDTSLAGYVQMRYKILEDRVDIVFDTSKAGYLKVAPEKGIAVDSRYNSIHLVIAGLSLRDELISHHVIAIHNGLKAIGTFMDVDIVIPDVSIYLALTKYTGKDYLILNAQREIRNRLGGISYTVERRQEEQECQV